MNIQILQAVKDIIKTTDFPYDKTFPSVIWGIENDKYQISYEGRLRSIHSALAGELETGTLVWVKIPNGKLKDMHICGIRKG